LIWIYLYNGVPTMEVYADYTSLEKCMKKIPDATVEFYNYNPYNYPLLKVDCIPLNG